MSEEYERGIRSVEPVRLDDLDSVFVPHRGSLGDLLSGPHLEQLKNHLVDNEWYGFEYTYRTPPLDDVFEAHRWVGQSNESDRHKELKVLGAHFLEYCGHTIPREDALTVGDFDCDWEFCRVFEFRYAGGIADVRCQCEFCAAVVEAGRVSPKKFLDTPADGSVDTFVVVPYDQGERTERGIEQPIYAFHSYDHSLTFSNSLRISEYDGASDADASGHGVLALDQESIDDLQEHVSSGGCVVFDTKIRLNFPDSFPKFIGPRGSAPRVIESESEFDPPEAFNGAND